MVNNVQADKNSIKKLEEDMKAIRIKDGYTPGFHLLPPVGWINDPNGLCELGDINHIFFQYSPYDAKGGDKYWGHYQTKDFINYEYTGVFLSPDNIDDKDGVYSGSAYVEEDEIYLYYTGNTKEEGDYDFVYEGRGANTILVTSKDGIEASDKKTLLRSEDYPKKLSCHVRDPKVWKENDSYYMVLGGRTKEDLGLVMLYESKDKLDWNFVKYISPNELFGYMWECPDVFTLDGKKILSLSPQGVKAEAYKYQNIYQSGYFVDDSLEDVLNKSSEDIKVDETNFREWDMGFDFYAPQTYMDEKGRRILIGWMGVPDAEYDHDPTIDTGWQHMLTVPRELTYDRKRRIVKQKPIEEFVQLRKDLKILDVQSNGIFNDIPKYYELMLQLEEDNDLSVVFDDEVKLIYTKEAKTLILKYESEAYGRTKRVIKLEEPLNKLQVLVDNCCMEVFINDGECVMTSKHFPKAADKRTLEITGELINAMYYELKTININEKRD